MSVIFNVIWQIQITHIHMEPRILFLPDILLVLFIKVYENKIP